MPVRASGELKLTRSSMAIRTSSSQSMSSRSGGDEPQAPQQTSASMGPSSCQGIASGASGSPWKAADSSRLIPLRHLGKYQHLQC